MSSKPFCTLTSILTLIFTVTTVLAHLAFKKELRLLTEERDRAWSLKVMESTVESYTFDIPEFDEYGEDISPTARRDHEAKCKILEEMNEVSRAYQKKVLSQPKIAVRHWEVYLGAFSYFLNGSRYIQYAKGCFKCMLAIFLLQRPSNKTIKTLSILSSVFFSPYSLANAFNYVIFLGRLMWITDDELMRELGWLLRAFRWLFPERKDVDESQILFTEAFFDWLKEKCGVKSDELSFSKDVEAACDERSTISVAVSDNVVNIEVLSELATSPVGKG